MAIIQIGVQPVISTPALAQVSSTYRVAAADGSTLSSDVACANDLSLAGNMNVVHWQGTDEEAFEIFKSEGGGFGFIGATSDRRFIDDNIAPDLSRRPPEPPPPVPVE